MNTTECRCGNCWRCRRNSRPSKIKIAMDEADMWMIDDEKRRWVVLSREDLKYINFVVGLAPEVELLNVLRKVEHAAKATGDYIGTNGQLIKEVRAAINKVR
jgi:hypothetical protein